MAWEAAFLGFEPGRLVLRPDAYWDGLAKDARAVRKRGQDFSPCAIARPSCEVAKEHDSSGKFLSAWPGVEEVGLVDLLAKRATARRQLGPDAAALPRLGRLRDVERRRRLLRDAGLDIGEETPTSKRNLIKVQEQFNAWTKEIGLPYAHLSHILRNVDRRERRGGQARRRGRGERCAD